jgi:hypothetical protein
MMAYVNPSIGLIWFSVGATLNAVAMILVIGRKGFWTPWPIFGVLTAVCIYGICRAWQEKEELIRQLAGTASKSRQAGN